MQSDHRRRIEAIEERLAASAETLERDESSLEILRRMFRVDRLIFGWEHYAPEEIMSAAYEYVERFEADYEAAAAEYETATEERRSTIFTEARQLKTLIGLLEAVAADAARDLGRSVTPSPLPIEAPPVSGMAPADLVALGLERIQKASTAS
jgi:hypothetical protein